MSTDTTADPIPTPAEINGPTIRQEIAALVADHLADLPPKRTIEVTAALYVMLDQRTARGPVLDRTERIGNQLEAEVAVTRLRARCRDLATTGSVRHLSIREVMQIINKPGEVT